MKADDIFYCPRLGARLSRQACYERQIRFREKADKKVAWDAPMSLKDGYCADAGRACRRGENELDKCGLGALHWRGFTRGTIILIVRAAPPPRSARVSFGRKRQLS